MKTIVIAILVGLAMFGSCLLSALWGAFVGWVIGATFLSDFVIPGFSVFGFEIVSDQLPGIGAMLGFVGGFFRSSSMNVNIE